MRRPRVRFTIRRTMFVVAAIAIVLGIGGMVHRYKEYRRIAEYHRLAAEGAGVARQIAVWKAAIDEQFNEKSSAHRHMIVAYWIGRMGSFHSELFRKYHQAAWTPWRLPEVDPPIPQRPTND